MVRIETGKPYIRNSATCVPIKFTYPDGYSEETIMIWNEPVTPDRIISDLKKIYVEWYIKHRNILSPNDLKSIEGLKIDEIFE